MKKKVTLYSLDEKQYPNIEIEVEVIEDTAKEIEKISEGKSFPAIKKATIQARPAKTGEVVDTRPRVEVDGKIYILPETTRTVTEKEEVAGAMIVVNPDGEEYLIKTADQFHKKYEETSKGYVAIDGVKSFVKSNGNYAIQTSWGQEQIVLKGSYFCVQDTSDIYGVTNTAFDGTYATDPNQIRLVAMKMESIKQARTEGVTV